MPEKLNIRPYNNKEALLFPPSIGDYLPKDDLAQVIKEFKVSFVKILQICYWLGIVKLGEISLDSKVMKANAAANRTYTEKELMKEHNSFICPAGKVLYWIGQRKNKGVEYSIYHNYRDCKVCEYWGKCTKSRSGRFIEVSAPY